MVADEIFHHLDAVWIIQNYQFHSALSKQIFSAQEILVLADHDARDAIEECRSGTHDAGTERAEQRQFRPVAPATRIAQTYGLGMGGRIPGLHTKIVPAGHDIAGTVRQH